MSKTANGLCPQLPNETTTTKYLRQDGSWVVPPNTNTTYSAGTGISLSGTTFSNSGVRSVASGSTNGTISVNTNGTSANVAVKGLGSAAYTASTAYAATSHTHVTVLWTGNANSGTIELNTATGTPEKAGWMVWYFRVSDGNGSYRVGSKIVYGNVNYFSLGFAYPAGSDYNTLVHYYAVLLNTSSNGQYKFLANKTWNNNSNTSAATNELYVYRVEKWFG